MIDKEKLVAHLMKVYDRDREAYDRLSEDFLSRDLDDPMRPEIWVNMNKLAGDSMAHSDILRRVHIGEFDK